MPEPTTIAAQVAAIRDALPTTLGSAELRDALAADLRARSVFAARLGNAAVVSELKDVIDALAAGEINHASGRLALLEVLRAMGYTPEGGFPEAPAGAVPPAVAGSIRDLSSRKRLDFILRTQLALVRGRGLQARGSAPARLAQFPAWELIRAQSKIAPRAWGGNHPGTPPVRGGGIDPRPRWIIAGGQPTADGRLIALKGDPIWGELGSSENFDDALDVDFPPFAFNSGMRWQEVSRGEVNALRITGPNGESPAEWLARDHPTLVDTQSGIPAPQGSVKDLDPALVAAFERSGGMAVIEGTATTPGNAAALGRQLEARRLAREARQAERLRQSVRTRQESYGGRGT